MTVGNLFDESHDNLIIISEISEDNNSALKLYRNQDFEHVYEHGSIDTNLRKTKMEVDDLEGCQELMIFLTWSDEEIKLSVGPDQNMEEGLRHSKSQGIVAKLRQDKLGNLVFIGDENLQVGSYQIRKNGELVLETQSKEVADFKLEKCEKMLDLVEGEDFLAESTITQQVVINIVTAFEAYLQKRFVEIAEEKNMNLQELIDNTFSKVSFKQKKQYRKAIEKEKEPKVAISERHEINFQSIDTTHNIFFNVFSINLKQFLSQRDMYEGIARTLNYRHKIIHEPRDNIIINKEKLPKEEPGFSDKDYAEEKIEEFRNFFEEFHDFTAKK
ncbi:MAG: hypothetical protein ABEK16_00040 [Candidatus Nanohalobium sp.]